MNTALQCISHSQPLLFHLPSTPVPNNSPPLLSPLVSLLSNLWSSPPSISSLTPSLMKEVIGRQRNEYGGYRQQDAHEFLLWLLDGIGVGDKGDKGGSGEEGGIGEGRMRSRVRCDCGNESIKIERFLDLSVPVPVLDTVFVRPVIWGLYNNEGNNNDGGNRRFGVMVKTLDDLKQFVVNTIRNIVVLIKMIYVFIIL
eukprot:TRINITY_DN2231_c0_g2_i1.p1 TRINITY_DN2231_c0_g2~~TRINITY_DN2231_c0_g2_i1.p1  ORF type:complete len:198 (-),score=63.99 TRINITY_DN2231_c0_g2_i1:202-795(-)